MAWGRRDERDPLERAIDAARGLKAGSWESVEALAMLAIETRGRPEARGFLDSAARAASGLSSGSWSSIRALAWLTRARRELGVEERG